MLFLDCLKTIIHAVAYSLSSLSIIKRVFKFSARPFLLICVVVIMVNITSVFLRDLVATATLRARDVIADNKDRKNWAEGCGAVHRSLHDCQRQR